VYALLDFAESVEKNVFHTDKIFWGVLPRIEPGKNSFSDALTKVWI
jgi:hypothetical protein